MESEHDDAGELVEVIKHITHNVTPPPEACTTRKAMYNGINEMIDDLMEHISPKTMCCSRVPSQVNKKGARERLPEVRIRPPLMWPFCVRYDNA